jgi:lysophospholipase L1-like esterase
MVALGVAAAMAIFLVVVAVNGSRPSNVAAVPEVMPTIKSDAVGPLTIPESPDVLIMGDSYLAGHGIESSGQPTFGPILADTMGWTNYQIDALGGTGFAINVGGGDYPTRLAERPAEPTPNLVILQGSVNDVKADPAAVTSAVSTSVSTIQSRWPDAQIVIVTPITAVSGYTNLADAYAKGASGRAHVVNATGDNSWLPADRPELLTPDLYHPSVLGHQAIAAGLANAINGLVATP